jgi:hypothetical protein
MATNRDAIGTDAVPGVKVENTAKEELETYTLVIN